MEDTFQNSQIIENFTGNDYFTLGNYYVKKKKIGMGSFATIYHGIEKDNKIEVAIKRIHVKDVKKITANIIQEIDIMKELKHPNIIRMYDVIYERDFDNVNIIIEYAPNGNLSDYLKKIGVIPEIYCKYYMRQIRDGLKYLLSKNIIHRDLKPQNILMFPKNIVKLADFGFARNFQEDQLFNTLCGSPLYMSPEIVIPNSPPRDNPRINDNPRVNDNNIKIKKNKFGGKNTYTIKSDLWSVGIILYELITGKYPIKPKTLYHLPQELNDTNIQLPNNIKVSLECRDLVNRLLIKNPEERIDWIDFFNHSWFNINEIEELENDKLKKENQLLEQADIEIYNNNSIHLNNNIHLNNSINKLNINPKNKSNKLNKLNFELTSINKNNKNNNRFNNSISHSSIGNQLNELNNSFSEINKSYNIQNTPPKNKILEPDKIKLNIEIKEDKLHEELFMSCNDLNLEDTREEQKDNLKDNIIIKDIKLDIKDKNLEKKLDLILEQLNEIKSIHNNHNNNNNHNNHNNNHSRIRQYSENDKDNIDEVNLSFNKIIEGSYDTDNDNYHIIGSSTSFDENYFNDNSNSNNINSSKPIGINKNKLNNNNNHNNSPITESIKYYISSSINIIKESANYISGNHKSF